MSLITGTLRDPTGEPLTGHSIRVSSKDDLSSTITTDSLGMYSFPLDEGWHHIEVLFKGTYLLVGDIIVNDALPSPSNLEEALTYSTPVTIGSIYEIPYPYDNLQNTLEDGTFTRKREDRDQLVDVLVHSADLTESWVSGDELERSISTTNELSTCGASIVTIDKVYSDDEGNNYSQSTGSVKSKDGEVKHETFVADHIEIVNEIEFANYTSNRTRRIDTSVSTNTLSFSKGNVHVSSFETMSEELYQYWKTIESDAGDYRESISLDSSTINKSTNALGYEEQLLLTGSNNTRTLTLDKGSKRSSDTYSNDGTSSQRELLVDNYVVGREGNKLLEVDTLNDKVYIRGILQIEDVQDEDGNSLIPTDGDTIFQVFRYGETESGPWEDTLQSYHYWKQENYSVNGVIDPNSWSVAYKFRGEDVVGDPGDTIYYEYNYSPDGVSDWSVELKAGDAFRRERIVTNGVAGEWSEPTRIKGDNGDEIEIRSQYSVNGVNTWHGAYVSGDVYERRARFVNGMQDSAWSDPIQIVGSDGDDGIPGLNGSGWYSIVNGTGVWPGDTQATIDFLNTFGRVPQLDDHLFYVDKDPDPTKTDGRRCITEAGESPVQWNNPRAYFDGDVIVKGTLSADRLVAQSVTGNEIDSQTTIIAGSGSSSAGMNGYDLATLPDWMGGGSNPYAGYRFWSGSSTPEFANFTVDSNGKMKSIDGEFSGTITMIGTSGLKVESNTPFGPDDLLEWRGSASGKLNGDGTVNLNSLTKVNATTYYSDENVAYFGGTIIAGTLTTSNQNPSTSSIVEVSTGNFGSNGGQIAVACGISSNGNTGLVSGTCTGRPDPTLTLTLYSVNIITGAETLVQSESFTGNYFCSPEGNNTIIETYGISGSFTYFDNNLNTNDRQFILKATLNNTFSTKSQRLSIVTQE